MFNYIAALDMSYIIVSLYISSRFLRVDVSINMSFFFLCHMAHALLCSWFLMKYIEKSKTLIFQVFFYLDV